LNNGVNIKSVKNKNMSLLQDEYAKGKTKLTSFPSVLYLEATAICNLRCPMCPTTIGLPRDQYRTDKFDFGLLPKIEQVLPYVVRCFLSGGGEPLLHPKFFEIVALLKKHSIEVHFNSNATLMNKKISGQLIEYQFNTISFSIDGATSETYKKIRVGADLEKVIENIKGLVRAKKETKSALPYLNMQLTLMKENMGEIEKIVELAASLQVNHLVIEPLTPVYCFDAQYKTYYEDHKVEPKEVIDSLRSAKELCEKLGPVFSSHYLYKADNPEPPRKCAEPWINFGARVDGRVFTCCGTIEPMGDLAEQSFDEIWNGPKYIELRKNIGGGNFPDYCSLCITENRANHFNEDILSR
jgi:MoaA/NifB/PqqE/SkfB family radical SAM enzyme